MDENNIGNGFAPAFAVSSDKEIPLPFEQALTDVPSGQKTTVQPPAVQLTSRSIRRLIKRNAIIAAHWLNLPLVDGLTTVAGYYKVIEKIAFNYQRQHVDAFFGDAYPELMLLFADEVEQGKYQTSSERRTSYRKFAKRLAHFYYHYCEAKKMQTGALINLLNLTLLNGTEVTKEIASAVRWSRINTASNLYERLPVPNGVEAYVTSVAKYASGKTSFGADVVSIPLWITDVIGNRHHGSMPYDGVISGDAQGATNVNNIDKDTGEFGEYAEKLVRNIGATITQYVSNSDNVNGKSPFKARKPFMPIVENGSRLYAQASSIQMNVADGIYGHREPPVVNGYKDNLTSRLWENYNFWSEYLIYAFNPMMDPNNDLYTFATEQLKIVSKASTAQSLLRVIQGNGNIDISSLASLMIYKQKNRPTTETVIKYMPCLYDVDNIDQSIYSDAFGETNLERYDVDQSDIGKMIESAKAYPHLNPTIFTDETGAAAAVGERPLVLNVPSSVSDEYVIKGDRSRISPFLSVTGKFAVMLDHTVSSSFTPDLSLVKAFGIATEAIDKYVADGNAVVYEENPTTPWVMFQPPIDASDLSQCGFMVMVSHDDPNMNEWERYLTDPTNYLDYSASNPGYLTKPLSVRKEVEVTVTTTNEDGTETSSKEARDIEFPVSPYFDSSNKGDWSSYGLAHTCNKAFVTDQKHVFVFVGMGIFSQPFAMQSDRAAGYFSNHISFAATENASFKRYLNDWKETTKKGDAYYAYGLCKANAFTVNNEELDADLGTSIADFITDTISETVDKNAVELREFIFAPEYGRIMPGTIGKPTNGRAVPLLPMMKEDDGVYEFTNAQRTPKIASAKIGIVVTGSSDDGRPTATEGQSLSVESSRITVAYDPFTTPASMLVWFLDRFDFAQVSMKDGIPYVLNQDTATQVQLGDLSKWVLALNSRTLTQFVGMHDTTPFWSNCGSIKMTAITKDGLNVRSSSHFPENNILVLPRAVQAINNNTNKGRSDGPSTGNPTQVSESQAAMNQFGTGGQSSGNKSKSNKGKSFSKSSRGRSNRPANDRRKTSYDTEVNADAVQAKAEADAATYMANISSSQGGANDPTPQTTDKDYTNKKKRPADGVATQM